MLYSLYHDELFTGRWLPEAPLTGGLQCFMGAIPLADNPYG
jgi:hypothetical protein